MKSYHCSQGDKYIIWLVLKKNLVLIVNCDSTEAETSDT